MRVSYEDFIDVICDADFETKLRDGYGFTTTPRDVVTLAEMEWYSVAAQSNDATSPFGR